MAREDLSKTYLYDRGEWVELPRDDIAQEVAEGRENPAPTPEWYESLGYYPRPVVFGEHQGGAYVEVYTQSADSDDAPYTFMCNVGIAGSIHRVFAQDTPSLIGLINEMGPAMQHRGSPE